jgi:pantothenate kinase-related protein Tda10
LQRAKPSTAQSQPIAVKVEVKGGGTMGKVKISFSGPSGTGKTVLSQFIRQALAAKGVDVEHEGDDLVVDSDQTRKLSPEYLVER